MNRMIVLGLDTTTKSGGIALRKEDGQENAYVGDSSLTHSERLPGEIIQFLEGNGVELSEVDRFAVLSGLPKCLFLTFPPFPAQRH